MPRTSEPDMHDVTDREIHRAEGVDPYPVPKKIEEADRPADDNGVQHPDIVDGQYTDGVDKMKKTLKDTTDIDEWRKGKTQNAPSKP